MNNEVKKTAEKSSHALAWSIAAVVGTGLGLLFATEKGKEVRSDLADKAKDLAKGFKKTRKEVQEYVQDIFGKVSDELEQSYVEIKSDIIAEIEDQKDKFDEKKYDKLIDNTVAKYSKGREWSKDAVKKLTNNLKSDWQDLKKEFKLEEKKSNK